MWRSPAPRTARGADDAKHSARELKIIKLATIAPRDFQQVLTIVCSPSGSGFQPASGEGAERPQPPAIAFDERSKSVLIRGTTEQVEKIAKLAAEFDKDPTELEAMEVEGMHVLPIRHVNTYQINGVLTQLQIPSRVMQLGKGGIVFITPANGDSTLVDQVKKVIAVIDVEEKSEPIAVGTPVSAKSDDE